MGSTSYQPVGKDKTTYPEFHIDVVGYTMVVPLGFGVYVTSFVLILNILLNVVTLLSVELIYIYFLWIIDINNLNI